jgi:site-specific recombinase XerD
MTRKIDTANLVSRDDLERMLVWHEKNSVHLKAYLRDYTILLLLGDAGLRVGELVQIETDDIIKPTCLVTSLLVRAEIAKYNIQRIVPLSRRLRGALYQYATESNLYKLPARKWVFPGRLKLNTHITERQIQNITARIGTSALGRQIHPHMLRHGFATHLQRTTPLPVVQRLMGHRNLSSTQVYCHPDEKDLFDAIQTL